jgi:CheY-like chemotaxis protein
MEKKILVADDSEILLELTQNLAKEVCKSLGIEAAVDCVSSGKDAVEKAKANDYALVILDNNMESYNDGARSILEMRALGRSFPIALYTSAVDVDKAEAVRNAGAQIIIKQPGGDDRLEDFIRSRLGKK